MKNSCSLIYFRVCFGLIMMVYISNKIGRFVKDGQDDLELTPFPFSTDRIPTFLHNFVQDFPFYSNSKLYWNIHYSFQLLACVGISFSSGSFSRFSCLFFAIYQLVNVLKSMSDYNNHEYLYSLISLLFSVADAHPSLNSCNSKYHSFGLFLAIVGTGYMMLWNVIYGIAGFIAIIGMPCIFIGVGLMLGAKDPKQFPDIPIWNYWIFQIFLGSVYFYAGIAKFDEDWLNGFTIRELYLSWTGPTILRPYLEILIEKEWPLLWIAYSGFLFDLLVPFGLMAPHNFLRYIFAILALGFHLMNHFTFVIETFPWVMITSLVIYFDSDWFSILSYIDVIVQKWCFPTITFSRLPTGKWFSLFFLSLILGVHLLIALPCAIFTLQGHDTVNYSSQCQFFSWRMMTRSSKLFCILMYLKNEKTNEIDPVLLDQFHLAPEEISSISIHEDYLYRTAQQMKVMAMPSSPSAEYVPPIITADIWVQINGPPIQRYVDPSMDLSQPLPHSTIPTPPFFSFKTISSFFTYQLSSYPWVDNRIQEYRTPFWSEIYRNITKYETTSSRIPAASDNPAQSQLLFFTDRAGSDRVLVLHAKEISLLRILSGQLRIKGYGYTKPEECLLVQGYIHITVTDPSSSSSSSSTTTTTNSNDSFSNVTSLWMIRDRSHSVVVLSKYSSFRNYLPLKIYDRYHCPLHSISSSASYHQNHRQRSQKVGSHSSHQKRSEL